MATFFDFPNNSYKCQACGWEGISCDLIDGEAYGSFTEYHCPACKVMIDIMLYPTINEMMDHGDDLSVADKAIVSERLRWDNLFEMQKLISTKQLPDIAESEFVLVWDGYYSQEHRLYYTTIKHNERIIWQEPAVFEGAVRFKEIVLILKKRYGEALHDLIPLKRTFTYLLGDDLFALDKIRKERKLIAT